MSSREDLEKAFDEWMESRYELPQDTGNLVRDMSIGDIENIVKDKLKKLDMCKYKRTSIDISESALGGIEIRLVSLKCDRSVVKSDMFFYNTSPIKDIEASMELEVKYLNEHKK